MLFFCKAKENRDLRSNQNSEARSERGQETQESSERSNSHTRTQPLSNCVDTNQQVSSPDQGSPNQGTSVASHFGELLIKLCSTPRNQKLLPLLLAITFVVLLLMQVFILVQILNFLRYMLALNNCETCIFFIYLLIRIANPEIIVSESLGLP